MKKRYSVLWLLLVSFLLSGCFSTNISERLITETTPETTETPVTEKPPVSHIPAVKITDIVTTVSTDETDFETTATEESREEESSLTTEAPPEEAFVTDGNRFTDRLYEIKEDYGIYGMSVALFKDGEIVHTESVGLADVKEEIPCTDNTRYRIASLSKLVSTMMIMKLCDEGKLSTDTVLSEATGLEYDYKYSDEKVKLWHVLTHTAGLIDTGIYEDGANFQYSISRIFSGAHNGYDPGEVFNYSNFGSGSMGAIIECITGEYFCDYAEKSFFTPLGMDAAYVIDYIDDKDSCANVYDYDGEIFKVGTWKRNRKYYEGFGLGNSYYSAQCELIITASDMAKLGIALCGDGTYKEQRILSKESVEAMNSKWFSTEKYDMGLNVRIYDDVIENRVIYGHPGNALGCITGLFYDPSDQTGVVVLTNRCMPIVDNGTGFYTPVREIIEEAYTCYLGGI